jgi:hypothetical protein
MRDLLEFLRSRLSRKARAAATTQSCHREASEHYLRRCMSRTGAKIWTSYPNGCVNIRICTSNSQSQGSGTGQAAAPCGKVVRRVSRPHLVRNRYRSGTANVCHYFRWLETAYEYFPYWDYPGRGRWMIYGMELADPILEKVYHKNAEKILPMYHGEKR